MHQSWGAPVRSKTAWQARRAATCSSRSSRFPSGRALRIARAALAGWLGGCPQADEAILIASEFATNSVLHSASRHGGAFTLRAEVRGDRLRIEVEDAGGPWRGVQPDDGRPHGLDVVAAIAGPGNWVSTETPAGASHGPGLAGEIGMTVLLRRPTPRDLLLPPRSPVGSAYWHKKHGVWRVAEDDLDSDLYAESSDADTVISYMTASCSTFLS